MFRLTWCCCSFTTFTGCKKYTVFATLFQWGVTCKVVSMCFWVVMKLLLLVSGWWFCQCESKRGWVPASYLEPLDGPEEAEEPEPDYEGKRCVTYCHEQHGGHSECLFSDRCSSLQENCMSPSKHTRQSRRMRFLWRWETLWRSFTNCWMGGGSSGKIWANCSSCLF